MESFPITENFSNHRPSFCREQPDFGRTLVLQGFLHLLPQQQEILGICANWKYFKIFSQLFLRVKPDGWNISQLWQSCLVSFSSTTICRNWILEKIFLEASC